jgi:hypothetical protein
VFSDELKSTGIIHVGGAAQARSLFSTVLHLVKAPRSQTIAHPKPPGGRR